MRILVIGAGGHARSACDVLLSQGEHEIIGLLDPFATEGFFGIPLLGDDMMLEKLFQSKAATGVHVALGANDVRSKLMRKAEGLGYELVSAISPHATVSRFATLGKGCIVMPGATINANTFVGNGCILNTNCSVDHDNRIGDYCHIAPGSTLCGTVTIGEGTFIGAGAKVIDKIQIGSHVMLGAGAVAVKDIPSYCTAVGVPAKVIKQGADLK